MGSDLNTFLFGYYPYICLTVFFIGSLIRFDREQYTWRSGSSQLLRRKQMRVGSNLFHIGVLIIFFGHLFGLLVPVEIYEAVGIGHTFKQVAAITVGGIAGVLALIGSTMLLHRRLADPRIRRTSAPSDHFVLILLWVQLVLGMMTIPISAGHLDGHMMVQFMGWAQGIWTFQPGAAALVAGAPFIFKLHLFLGLTTFLVFPFTRLVHVWSVPVWYVGRQGFQIVRRRGSRAA
jgi:nitrate reductase gamma subunit